MSGGDTFLSVRDIWKTYAVPHGGGSRPVLRGLDFCLERGEMAGLVGESGSGKSTLARLLLGLEPPDRGTVLLEGQPLRQWRARGGRLSVVFQDYMTSVNPGFTLAEVVDEGLGPGCGLSRRERRWEVDRLLEIKRNLPEIGLIDRVETLHAYIDAKIALIEEYIAALPKEEAKDWKMLDEIFLDETARL